MSRSKVQFWVSDEFAQGVQNLHPNSSAVCRALLAIGWVDSGLPLTAVEREIGQALRDGVPEPLRSRLVALLATKDTQAQPSASTQQPPVSMEQAAPIVTQTTMPPPQNRTPLTIKEPEPVPPPVPRSPLAGIGMDADWDDE